MIKLKRPALPIIVPYASQAKAGQCKLLNERSKLERFFLTNGPKYNSGKIKMTFKQTLYGHSLIKTQLRIMQQGRCCYCENIITDRPTVEHFRPKQGYKQSEKKPLSWPGYYWLAYEWTNIMYACTTCNQKKGNLFPITDNRLRVKNHIKDSWCNREISLLIDPTLVNPENFFRFKNAEIFPKNLKHSLNNTKAKTTWETVKLYRTDLLEERREYLDEIKSYEKSFLYGANTSAEKRRAKANFIEFLKIKSKPGSRFSLMVKYYLKSYLHRI